MLERYGMTHSPSHNYQYDGLSFDSSWELAYYIWLKDNNKDFEYPCKTEFEYFDLEGIHHTYYPDFAVDGQIIEIKGNHFINSNKELYTPYRGKKMTDEEYEYVCMVAKCKFQCMIENGVTILSKNEITPYLKYVSQTYGKDFLKSFTKDNLRIMFIMLTLVWCL